jgi:hypothetical protein
MNAHPLTAITNEQVDTFWRDGVTCLRGLFGPGWIDHMREALEDDLARPGPLAREYAKDGGRFLGDIGACASTRSRAASIRAAGALRRLASLHGGEVQRHVVGEPGQRTAMAFGQCQHAVADAFADHRATGHCAASPSLA